jgi:hypothetical protein
VTRPHTGQRNIDPTVDLPAQKKALVDKHGEAARPDDHLHRDLLVRRPHLLIRSPVSFDPM